MNGRWMVCALVVAGLLLGAGDADARRRKGRSRAKKRSAPPSLVVAPFEGHGKKSDKALARSVELELELVDGVRVEKSAPVAKDLRRKKSAAFEASTLKAVLKKRKIDILLRGVKGWTEDGKDVTWVVMYGQDGQPRFMEPFELAKDTDGMAQRIAAGIAPALRGFSGRSVVEVVFPEKPKPVTDSDLFVDPDEGGKRDRSRVAGGDAEPKKRRNKALEEIRAAKRDKPRERPKLGSERKQAGVDDPPETLKDEPGEGTDGERRLAADGPDDEEKAAEAGPSLSHLIAVSFGAGGGGVMRSFEAEKAAQTEPAFVRGMVSTGLRLSFWPIEWVGVDSDLRADGVRYTFGNPNPIDHEQIITARFSASAAAKARYILHLGPVGVGGGVRLGGRYNGMPLVPEQRASDGELLTLVPSYNWYNLTVGAELWLSFVVFDRRIEIEPKVDFAPLAAVFEGPDWPGASSLTLGWSAQNAIRAEIFYGAFVELYTWHTGGWSLWFNGAGTRRGRLINNQSGQREFIQGGVVWNLDAGAQLGVGWMW